MTAKHEDAARVEQLLETPALADALESDRFKRFLDHIPFAVVVSELRPSETIAYANIEFERLTELKATDLQGKPWACLVNIGIDRNRGRQLCEAVVESEDFIGVFTIRQQETEVAVDAWSNIVQDDDGTPTFRLVALAH